MFEWRPDPTHPTHRQWIATSLTETPSHVPLEAPTAYLDIRDGSSSFSPSRLKLGALSHLALLALGERPDTWIPSEDLFAKIYPGQFFHPVHARYRLKHVAFLLRAWLRESKIPMDVQQKAWRYRLVPLAGLRLLAGVSRDTAPSSSSPTLVWLREFVRSDQYSAGFTTGQLAKFLAISNRSANYRLHEAIEQGYVRARGRGRATRYEIKIEQIS